MDAELTEQIKQFDLRKQAEQVERKEKIMTSGGPTQEPEDLEALQKKFRDQQKLTALTLAKQRDMDKEQIKVRKDIDTVQEKQDAEIIAAKHLESRAIKQEQRKQQLQHFRAVWDAQKELKQKTDEVEKVF